MRVYPLAISALVAATTAATTSAFVVPSAPLSLVRPVVDRRHEYGLYMSSSADDSEEGARTAYDEWRVQFGKGDFDAARFEAFKSNLAALTAANEASMKQARDAGMSEPPKKLELNEFADMTAEEYKAATTGEPAAEPSMDFLGAAKEAFGKQSEASSALEEANAALAEEEEKLAQELGLESVEELEEALDSMAGIASDGGELESSSLSREARVRSAYMDWCRENGKEADESRFPAFEANYLAMEQYANESGKELVLNKYADCTEEEYSAILKAEADAAEEQKAQEAAAKAAEDAAEAEKAAAAKAAKEAEDAAREEEAAAKKAAREAELKKIAAEAAAAKKAQEAEIAARKAEEEKAQAAREKERKERQAAQEKLSAQRAQEAEAAAIAAAREQAERDAEREARSAALREKEREQILRQAREKQAQVVAAQAPVRKKAPSRVDFLSVFGGDAQKTQTVKSRKSEAPRAKTAKSEGLFSFFAPPAKPAVTKTLKKAAPKKTPKKAPAKSAPAPDFLSIFSSPSSKTKSTPKARETPAVVPKARSGGLFSFLSGSGSQPTSTRTLIPASRKATKGAKAPRKAAPVAKKAAPVAKKGAPPVAKSAAPFSFFKAAPPKKAPEKKAPPKKALPKKTAPKAAAKKAAPKAAKGSSTLPIKQPPKEKKPAFSFFGGGAKAPATTPEIPVLKNFVQNKDGSITGKISNSKQFKNGTTITTSPIRGKAKRGSLVQTKTGSRYRLE